ncbi:MAG: hypothetical protein VB861_01920 [Planctomycetaceae bacterium]
MMLLQHDPHARHASQVAPATLRRGATLTEVLMSMLILSIGVICLATLFPVGMLNSVRASKLTKATMLRNNCDAMLDILPHLVHDPDLDGNQLEHNNRIYAVDPFGFVHVGGGFGPLTRYHAGYNTDAKATNLVMLPDNWDDNDGQQRGAPEILQADWVQVPQSLNLIDVQVALANSPTVIPCRVILLDLDGQQSWVRNITSVNPATRRIYWLASESVPTTAKVTEVRVEIFNGKYSWMLTVRKPAYANGAAPASVDAVVFFNRPASVANEATYIATFGRGADRMPGWAGVDDDNNGTIDDNSELLWPDTDDLSTVDLIWSEDLDNDGQLDADEDINGNGQLDVSPYPPSRAVAGGYIFDTANGQWYKILQVLGTANGSADLQLDRMVTRVGNQAMAPSGIVAVYSLGTK